MLPEKPSTAVVVETEVLHHRLYVGLHAFRFPTTVYSTTEGLRESYETFEDNTCTHERNNNVGLPPPLKTDDVRITNADPPFTDLQLISVFADMGRCVTKLR